MKTYTDINHLPDFKRPVITIGSFDGLHKGHQEVLNHVNSVAREKNCESVIVTFEPHPRQIIYPQAGDLKLLTDLKEKEFLMQMYGVSHLVVVPFTIEFSQLNADEYIEKFLVEKFQPQAIVIGYDHRFGLNRQGDINFLKWYSQKYNFEVLEISKHLVNDITVSSTKIRKALEQADMKYVQELLNHPYLLIGKVIPGKQIGREIGYPTANILPANSLKQIPPDGIYAVMVHLENEVHKGVLYIGNKPTLGVGKRTIEVHLFNFNQNIYDREIMLEFVEYIRPDAKFNDIEIMKEHIARDKEKAASILENYESVFHQQWEAIH